MNQSESDLINAAKAGDNRAFDVLIRLNDKRILQVAHGIMGNMQDAYDVYQEGVFRAYRKLHSFRFESSFSTWLTRIVINQALNMKKRERFRRMLSLNRQGSVLREDSYASGTHPSTDRNLASEFKQDENQAPDEVYVTRELSDMITSCLMQLSDRERAVFVLKHMHGYKLREIALMIDCAEGTVKNYLFRATRKLRDQLTAVGMNTVSSSTGDYPS